MKTSHWPIFPTPHSARFFGALAMMPWRKGFGNYKNDLLIDIVAKILPNGEYGRQTVAIAYQEQSKENILHDSA
jgi:hypothetical protein